MPQARRSIADRLLDGSYKPSKHGPLPVSEPAAGEALKLPKALNGRAAKVWKELLPLLRGVVRRRDVPVLCELCRWVARSESIAEQLDALEVTTPAFKSLIVAAGIATDKVAKLSALFGLDPANGSKVRSAAGAGKVEGAITW